jgi:hypothetical protein
MVDSGAYSAFKIGVRLDIEAYIVFAQRNEPFVQHYVSLDRIPGALVSIGVRSGPQIGIQKGPLRPTF